MAQRTVARRAERPRGGRRHLLASVAATVAAGVSLAACGAGRTDTPSTATGSLPPGLTAHTLDHGGRARHYLVYRPDHLPDPAPLVVMLHGGFGSAAQAARTYGWNGQADRAGFVVAYPDGAWRAWNTEGGCCGRPARRGVDDVGFIEAVVRAVTGSVPVDPRRVYVTGMSNGGMMAYTLACRLPGLFAAIGPVAATQMVTCPDAHPVSVIHIHGSADTNVPFGGGPGSGPGRVDGPAVPAVVAGWRTVDRCGPVDTTTSGAVTTTTATCPHGRAVTLIAVAGAGHQWPGARPRPPTRRRPGASPPSAALDATATIWSFFAAHPRPATLAVDPVGPAR